MAALFRPISEGVRRTSLCGDNPIGLAFYQVAQIHHECLETMKQYVASLSR